MGIVEIIPPYLYSMQYDNEPLSLNQKMLLRMSLLMRLLWKGISINLPTMLRMVRHRILSPTFNHWKASISTSGN